MSTPIRFAGVQTGRWDAACSLSSAGFAVRNLGWHVVRGQVPITAASVAIDVSGRPTSVRAELDLRGIDTGNRKRDADLQKPHLLDTASAPTLVFTGTAAEDWSAVDGTLRGRAETPVVLTVTRVEHAADGARHVVATTRFDRRDLGVRAPRFLIGRYIDVTLDVVFTPPQD